MSVANFQNDLLGFIKAELLSRRGEWREISSAAEVPYFTLSKISNGATKDPRISSVQALTNYFLQHPKAA
jgi:predicted transcriptional regulator